MIDVAQIASLTVAGRPSTATMIGSDPPPPSATTLRMVGWKAGLQTVSLIQLVKEESTGSLGTAKRLVEALLEGNAVDLSFRTAARAQAFRDRAEGLGVIFG